MASKFPGALDALPTNKQNRTDFVTGEPDPKYTGPNPTGAGDHAANHNDANSAINAVQATLGLNPQGDADDVAERLDDADAALAAHVSDTSDAHDAAAISYAGGTGISADNVEGAIDELATEKANASEVATDTELGAEASARADGDAALTEALAAVAVTLDASGVGFVLHGSDAEAARPTSFASVIWRGTVEPNNADPATDTWIEV